MKVVIAQVLLCLLQLDHGDGGFGGGAEKLFLSVRAACRKTGGVCTVSGLVPGRNDRTRIFAGQCGINILPCVFASVGKTFRRRSGLDSLIPDCGDARGPVNIAENFIFIINSAVEKTDENSFSFQLKRGGNSEWAVFRSDSVSPCSAARSIWE